MAKKKGGKMKKMGGSKTMKGSTVSGPAASLSSLK